MAIRTAMFNSFHHRRQGGSIKGTAGRRNKSCNPAHKNLGFSFLPSRNNFFKYPFDFSNVFGFEDKSLNKPVERNALDAYIVSTSKKLENKEFLEKAPQKVINEMQNKCVEANARRIWLEERINAIKETP
jgi:hypothetical protein